MMCDLSYFNSFHLSFNFKGSTFPLMAHILCTFFRYYRSVAYRQFVRLVWEYVGSGRRIPLPCCVYNKIREKFPDKDNDYRGYEEEEEEEEEDRSDIDGDDDDSASLEMDQN